MPHHRTPGACMQINPRPAPQRILNFSEAGSQDRSGEVTIQIGNFKHPFNVQCEPFAQTNGHLAIFCKMLRILKQTPTIKACTPYKRMLSQAYSSGLHYFLLLRRSCTNLDRCLSILRRKKGHKAEEGCPAQ